MVKFSDVKVGSTVIVNGTGATATVDEVRVVHTNKKGRPAIWYKVGGVEYKGAQLSFPKVEKVDTAPEVQAEPAGLLG